MTEEYAALHQCISNSKLQLNWTYPPLVVNLFTLKVNTLKSHDSFWQWDKVTVISHIFQFLSTFTLQFKMCLSCTFAAAFQIFYWCDVRFQARFIKIKLVVLLYVVKTCNIFDIIDMSVASKHSFMIKKDILVGVSDFEEWRRKS